jgi:hypothetical protein
LQTVHRRTQAAVPHPFALEKIRLQTKSTAAKRLTGLDTDPGGSLLRRFCIHVAQIEDVAMKTLNSPGPRADCLSLELDALLHPARAFAHPLDVVSDPDLTLNEKRAVLASWASDACAVEAAPAWRPAPGGERPVSVDAILEALRELDKSSAEPDAAPRLRRHLRRRSIEKFRSLRHGAGDDSGNSRSH